MRAVTAGIGGLRFFVYGFGAVLGQNTAIEPPFMHSGSMGGGVQPPPDCYASVSFKHQFLPLYPPRSDRQPCSALCHPPGGRSLPFGRSWRFVRFGRSFDWNNPSMNWLYYGTFLSLLPYVRKVGNAAGNQKFPRLRKRYAIMAVAAQTGRRKGLVI